MAEKLMKLIEEKKIHTETLIFENTVKDSKKSADETGLELKKIVKTILFKDKNEKNYAVIIRGTERVSRQKVKNAINAPKLELIKFDDVIKRIGYPAGGVPPFGYEAQFIIDSDLKDEELVLVGGGTIYSLLKIKVEDIKKLSNPLILDTKK
jgi:Cys-tRNA(Pro)/Cys-tRNA(Cys) deacylase